MKRIQLLFSLTQNHIPYLKVVLTSLSVNNPGVSADIWLLHRSVSGAGLESLEGFCLRHGFTFHPVQVNDTIIRGISGSERYPREVYYRLLAPQLLPESLDRILYLDTDILIINPLYKLWEIDMEDRLFAAAAHTGKTELANEINKIRLGTAHNYYNSGVLLINLVNGRKEINPEAIGRFISRDPQKNLLPDQDVLNTMYGTRTRELDDYIWNYDARKFSTYLLRSQGKADMDWVIRNTVILHFCGSSKPWNPGYYYRFGILYKHYMQLAERDSNE